MPDWANASLIGSDNDYNHAPLIRTVVTPDAGHGGVTGATLVASGLGIFEGFVDGRPVGPDVFSPGWSSYEWRMRGYSYDVTGLVPDRPFVLGFSLGKGWAAGRIPFTQPGGFYAHEPSVIATLEITYSDGHRQQVVTDDTWQSGPSQTTFHEIYDGQSIDARIDVCGWNSDVAPRADWTGVTVHELDKGRLVPYDGPRVVRHEEIAPQRIWTSPSGKTLVDFGQNLVGWIRIHVNAPAGTEITVRHAEVLEHEELGTRPLRTAKATDTYTTSGHDDVFEPTKTFHGFRYAEVTGWPGELDPNALRAVVVHSEMARIGRFECSDEMLNQLHRNVVWGQRGNFFDVPTDCPQRDERLGWTGDIAAFAPAAAFIYDVKGFLGEWMANVDAEQAHNDGIVPFVVPDVLKFFERPNRPRESTCLWSDAGVWVPWTLYEAYGDEADLRASFGTMRGHVDHVETLLSPNGLWDEGFQFADWLDPTAPPDDPFKAVADKGVVATACLYRSVDLTARTAQILGETEAQARYEAYAARLKEAFNTHYVDGGRITSDCPTVYALAICFDLLSAGDERAAGDRLAELAAANGYRVATGFAGTPFVLHALSRTGHLDAAYRMLLERECPSWLYPVTMGATTIWERWDSMLPDGTINPGQMTSFNHYAFGAVADWMHKVIGGINPLEPGYSRVLISPKPGGGLTWASTSLDTPHGTVAVSWRGEAGQVDVDVTLPEGVTGVFRSPDGTEKDLAAGRSSLQISA
ncbi:MAG TPA: family 78 glycoside hydrolase catalytic domain [Propionibacteriaceae bacterium]|nr:family 78 glycoside hydrolase catalytic domain [Propionibacteriaceae bacterium]